MPVGAWRSAPVTDLLRRMNQPSDNFMAEMLVKVLDAFKPDRVWHLAANSDISYGTKYTDFDLKGGTLVTYDGKGEVKQTKELPAGDKPWVAGAYMARIARSDPDEVRAWLAGSATPGSFRASTTAGIA